MSTIETQAQADRLNAEGVYGPYRAFNGHLMIARLVWPKSDAPCVTCGGTGTDPMWDDVQCSFCRGKGSGADREFRVGDRITYTSYNAWCDSDCIACAGGYILEDW